MIRRSLKLAAILAAVLLFVGLAVALSPQEAYAGDYNYPAPENIYMDYDYSQNIHFTDDQLYFYSDIHSLNDAKWDAFYKPEDGILYLKNYNGSAIRVNNASGTQLTICLIGNTSTITTSGQIGIKAEGVRLIITTAATDDPNYSSTDVPKLIINQTYDSTGSDGAGIANYWSGGNVEDIVISGKAKVKINNYAHRVSSGIYTNGYLEINDRAELDISTTFAALDVYASAHGEAVYALKGLTVTTSSTVNLSAAIKSDWYAYENKVYALYMENGTINIDPSMVYVSLSAVGRNRAVCNETIPQRNYFNTGYGDVSYDTYAASARLFSGDDYYYYGTALNGYNFPDPDFRRAVKDLVDPYDNGWANNSDFWDQTSLTLDDGEYNDIETLKGIEYLTGLDYVSNEHGILVEADLSYNSELTEVYFWDNQIEFLNVCGCYELIYLDLDNNMLTSLDVSDNTKLNTLYCGNVEARDHFNTISVLDVSCCTELKYLYARGTDLKALKLGNNDKLKELSCYNFGDDYLEILDLRGTPILRETFTDYDRYQVESNDVEYYKAENDSYLWIDQNTRILTKDTDDISFYPTITNCKLNLAGKIGIRIYFKAPDYAATAKIYYEGYDYAENKAITISLSKTNNPNYNAAQDIFVMDFPRITSREMTMRIKFVILDTNGNPIDIYYEQEDMFFGGEFIYCAADWANRIDREYPSEKAVYMAHALLNYGGCAQKYLSNYNAARPANPRHYYDDVEEFFSTDSENDMVISGDPGGAGFDYIRLSLEADTAMRLYFNKAVTVTVDGASRKVYNSGSTWLALIEGISSRNISKKYNIVATSGGSTTTIEYSVLSWANDILAREVYAAKPTAMALYIYNDAALWYLGNP